MSHLLLSPPMAAAIVFGVCLLLSLVLSHLATRRKSDEGGARKSYACGEEVGQPNIQPNYGEFFPFAFFFTILHVVALVIATVQTQSKEAIFIAIIYIAGALIGLSILFRKGTHDESMEEDSDLGAD